MVVEKKRIADFVILTIGGVIKLGESAAFFAQTLERVLAEEAGHVLIDFSSINYIDSTGIGELVGYLNRFREHSRKLILVRPAERLSKLLAVAGLTELFPIYDTADEAMAAEA